MKGSHYLPNQLNQLPENPGVYCYYNKEEVIIYVGKAKNLKKRIQSYFFNKSTEHSKTKKLVSEIQNMEVILVNTETEAYLLENNLIKKYKPKYNILLKDDKSYPYIAVTKEEFPKVFQTRTPDKVNGNVYGPYTNQYTLTSLLELVRELFHVRTCNLALNENSIREKKFELCLEYHIGKCLAPCEAKQSREDYNKEIEEIRNILKGNLTKVKGSLKDKMEKAASVMDFESAHLYKTRLLALENYQSKTIIVNPSMEDMDVITILSDEGYAYINYLAVQNGAIRFSKTFEIKKKLNEEDQHLAELMIVDIQSFFKSETKHILTNIQLEDFSDYHITIPQQGDKRKLVELSLKNVLHFKKEKLAQRQINKQEESRILKTMARDLRMTVPPRHIECFDNSNLQGTNPVASMVCFKNAKPSKKDYRKFKIKTVVGPDDFRSMYEVVYRRYKRVLEEETPLPDLIVIDGGKGQLSFAVKALKDLGIYSKLSIIGIAKRLEELYYPEDQLPLYLDKKSESLKIIQWIRNEAHRFAITFHRERRHKSTFQSELETIKGIGDKTVELLLKEFRTISRIKEASLLDLENIIGKKKAEIIVRFFKKSIE